MRKIEECNCVLAQMIWECQEICDVGIRRLKHDKLKLFEDINTGIDMYRRINVNGICYLWVDKLEKS